MLIYPTAAIYLVAVTGLVYGRERHRPDFQDLFYLGLVVWEAVVTLVLVLGFTGGH
jgi:hypothetical protein